MQISIKHNFPEVQRALSTMREDIANAGHGPRPESHRGAGQDRHVAGDQGGVHAVGRDSEPGAVHLACQREGRALRVGGVAVVDLPARQAQLRTWRISSRGRPARA